MVKETKGRHAGARRRRKEERGPKPEKRRCPEKKKTGWRCAPERRGETGSRGKVQERKTGGNESSGTEIPEKRKEAKKKKKEKGESRARRGKRGRDRSTTAKKASRPRGV